MTRITCYLAFILWHCHPVHLVEWTNRPENLCVCAGDNVTFTWDYVLGSLTNPVISAYWISLHDGNTMASWQANSPSDIVVYEAYAGRIELLPGYNVGIQLLNATALDTGQYKLELAGPGIVDVTNLTVYQEADLIPTLYINNEPWNESAIIIDDIGNDTALSVVTGSRLSANITISITDGLGDRVLYTCVDQRICNSVHHNAQIAPNNLHHNVLSIRVTYGFCDVQHILVDVEMNIMDSGDDNKQLVIIIICVVMVTLLVVIIILIVCYFQQRSKNKKSSKFKEKEKESSLQMEELNSACNEDRCLHVQTHQETSNPSSINPLITPSCSEISVSESKSVDHQNKPPEYEQVADSKATSDAQLKNNDNKSEKWYLANPVARAVSALIKPSIVLGKDDTETEAPGFRTTITTYRPQ